MQKSIRNCFAMGFLHTWIMFLRSQQQVLRPVLNGYVYFFKSVHIPLKFGIVPSVLYYAPHWYSVSELPVPALDHRIGFRKLRINGLPSSPFSFPDQKTTCWKGTTRKTRTDVVAYHYRSLASVNAPFNSSIPLDIWIRSCYGEKSGTCTFNYRKYGFLYISMIQLRK